MSNMYVMYIYDILLPEIHYVNLIIVKMTFSKSSVNFYVSNLNNAKAHFSSEIRLLKHCNIFFPDKIVLLGDKINVWRRDIST